MSSQYNIQNRIQWNYPGAPVFIVNAASGLEFKFEDLTGIQNKVMNDPKTPNRPTKPRNLNPKRKRNPSEIHLPPNCRRKLFSDDMETESDYSFV